MSIPLASWARVLACLAFAALVHAVVPGDDRLRAGMGLFALIGALWMTQALHLAVTALLVPLLAVLLGLMGVREALVSFAHPVIFLFLGGFALASALQRQGLDRALAQRVLRLARGRRRPAVFLLFGMAALLSMWISNTATAAMMLPLALGLMDAAGGDEPLGPRERTFVLLGLAYSASIGGIGTLVGSPPNAIAAAQAGIGFAQWMVFGLPLVALLMPLMVGVLWMVLRPRLQGSIAPGREDFAWTPHRRLTVAIFAVTAAGWMLGGPLSQALGGIGDVDSLVALAAIVALTASGVLRWDDVEHDAHWGVLLLFGGGLALSQVMERSGASRYLAGELVQLLHGGAPWLVLLGVVAFVVFLTELVSNTASAALMIPLFIGVAGALGASPLLFSMAIAAAASCAFMLPVATPPNAIVYATGAVKVATMMRCGLLLNLACMVAVTAVAAAVAG